MKTKNPTKPKLNKIIKNSCLLLLLSPILSVAAERNGLILNGSVSAEYSDNILNNTNEISDTALIATPKLKYSGVLGKHKVEVNYQGKLASYTKDKEFNYNSHDFLLAGYFDHSHKINTEFSLGFDKEIETPGATNSSTQNLTNFNQLNTKSALARFYYGQRTSTGQIVIDFNYTDRAYTNNQQDYRDYTRNQANATFFYRIAPKTRMLFQASASKYSYDDQFTNALTLNQSSEQQRYLIGVEWQATAKTTGLFKIGYQNKDYTDPQLNDISDLSYNLDMIWKPTIYTKIAIGASREATESAIQNEGGFLSTAYSVNISHNLTARTTANLAMSMNNDDIVSATNRTDKRHTLGVGLKHSLRDWLNVKLSYKYQEKDSNIELFTYESNIIQLSFETTFK